MTYFEIIGRIESRRNEPPVQSEHHQDCPVNADEEFRCECEKLAWEDEQMAAESKWDATREDWL